MSGLFFHGKTETVLKKRRRPTNSRGVNPNDKKNDLSLIGVVKKIPISYGTLNVKQNGVLESIDEKQDLTFQFNAGIYIINPETLNKIKGGRIFHITDLIERIILENGKVGVFPVSEKSWSDIGEWSNYRLTLDKFGFESW